jgi:acetyl esterase/lipase
VRNQLDIYSPRVGVERAPVLLQIHGGGWTIGNKREQALPLMNHLAARGWVCVTANYRLSPKATFPDHLIDLKRVVHWIRNEIEAYGGDPNFIAATGGSAGGHLSSMIGLTANDPEYQPGFEAVDTSVDAVIPFYGVYDFSNHYGLQVSPGLEQFIARVVIKQKFSEKAEAFRRASPMHRMHADAPPFFIIHGTHDSLASVEEARHFAQALRQISKSPVAYAEIPGAQHAFELFHSLRTSAVVSAAGRFLSWVHAGYASQRPA